MPTPCTCAWPTKRLHRPAAEQGQLSEHPGHSLGGDHHRGRRDPPRGRLPVGERRLRRAWSRSTASSSSAPARAHRADGRQGRGQGSGRPWACPVVPGSDGAIDEPRRRVRVADEIGYPVLIKAAAGGGGRGMKVARTPRTDRRPAPGRSEAKAAFGNDGLSGEVPRPAAHIEVQILADGQGNVIHLGERDCSLQRRHQKLLEEAPSPALNARSARHRQASSPTPCASWATAAPARSSSSTRTAPSTSSK